MTAALRRGPTADSGALADGVAALPVGSEVTVQLRELVRHALTAPSGTSDSSGFADSPMASNLQGSTQRDDTNKGAGRSAAGQLGSLVLNAQSGGSVAHRVGTIPLIVNDLLVEVVDDRRRGLGRREHDVHCNCFIPGQS